MCKNPHSIVYTKAEN